MTIEMHVTIRGENADEILQQLRALGGGSFVVPNLLANVATGVDTADKPAKDAAAEPPSASRSRRRQPKLEPHALEASADTAAGSAVEPLYVEVKDETENGVTLVSSDPAERIRDTVDRITEIFKRADAEKRARIVAWREQVGLKLVRDLTPEQLPAAELLLQELAK